MISNNMQELEPPRLTIMLVSATALAYEILLMRLFSIIQYHHFAYMVISLALLGYGASGTFLVFLRPWFLQRFSLAFTGNILLFGITVVACFLGGQHLLFNPDELLWSQSQWLKLVFLYLLLALPFFFAANCIALTFSRFRPKISEIYAFDLLGAGLGSVLIIGLLFLFFPQKIVLLLGSIIFCICASAWLELGLQPRWRSLLFVVAAGVFFLLPASWTDLAVSPYKGLSQQLRIAGSSIIEKKSSPLALLTLVENDTIPFRYAPGLSLSAETGPPEQLGLFIDAGGMDVITRFHDDITGLDYLGELVSALPYHLELPEEVLILGSGGGTDILQALYFGVPQITAVELNRQILQLVGERPEFSGNLYKRKNVSFHISEARSFVSGSTKKFDLIKLPGLAAFSGSSAGFYTLHENYLYTVEAFKMYFNALTASGYLSVGSWIKLPPRDSLKLFGTAVQALEELGLPLPEDHLILIRSWQAASLLVKRSPISPEEIMRLKKFCRQHLFDLVYYPAMKQKEANRINILRQPYFHDAAVSLLGDNTKRFQEKYKFNIKPATDDKPYFSNFFKWQTLPEILRLRGQGGMALLEAGYLILLITFFQAAAASLVIILLPVVIRFHALQGDMIWSRSRTVLYFFGIGLAFLFLEIAFIQKFILYLGHPLYAAAAVLALFLVFAGLGSHYARKKSFHVIWPVAIILVLGLTDLAVFKFLFEAINQLPPVLKILTALLMLGPLAFCMGMPFPLALTWIGGETPDLVPWAWAVNGCASVIAAVLATLLAVHFGFAAVVLTALLLYGLAAAVFPAGQNLKDGT